ncbi:hypothetical protein [Streptomyces noursei]|uniref:hypothetical protein n=1 Tax=Streptomyces noursei TaxID=1971 RepID=UPI0016747E13|nr:hypothetical protein [Streptomyces noursei]MCZ1015626.1 hypothetical protein [Streptomyces noursei]GGW89556.1 hypothetical protein GCM10010341_07990 [Streptomyces noursei]
MKSYVATSPAVATFTVTFRDGSSTEIHAKRLDVDEYGLAFVGRKNDQSGRALVAFVPHADLRMVTVEEKSKVTKVQDG